MATLYDSVLRQLDISEDDFKSLGLSIMRKGADNVAPKGFANRSETIQFTENNLDLILSTLEHGLSRVGADLIASICEFRTLEHWRIQPTEVARILFLNDKSQLNYQNIMEALSWNALEWSAGCNLLHVE